MVVLGGLLAGDPRQIGPYRLLDVLGSGGFGRVFLGLSPDGRLVAVKVIRPELAADPEFRTRFRREVAAARKVSGRFTAQVVDADAESLVFDASVAQFLFPLVDGNVGEDPQEDLSGLLRLDVHGVLRRT